MNLFKLDIGYIPCHPTIVSAMLDLAEITKDDVLYDLGCGDGRIVITAAQKYHIPAVGIDLDPQRIADARNNAIQAGVSHQVNFLSQNLFESDFSQATVITLYLLPHLNLKLRPLLWQQLKPGSRIISRDFDMEDWPPSKIVDLQVEEEDIKLYSWVVS
uniref:Putative RNA methylase n=2 Tax=Gloeothece TaxID=28070 RepID=E0U7T4_GLOV7|nr:putative RNA methylase [Gloeothece verrucosa PCC 7822]